MPRIEEAVGRSAPFVQVQPPAIIAQRAPTTADTNYPFAQVWLDQSATPSALYTHIGGGTWDQGGNAIATNTVYGLVQIDTDGTFASADDLHVPTVLASKTYTDSVAVAGAPVATEGVAGIGELATDAEAVAGTASTALVALLVTPSNFSDVFASPPALGGTSPGAGDFTGLTADGTGTVTLVSNAAGLFDVTGAGIDLTLSSDAGRVIVNAEEAAANAITILSAAGGIDADAALQINIATSQNAADAIRIVASAGGIDVDAVGSAGEDISIVNTGGSLILQATESATDAVTLEATLGGINVLASGASAGEDINVTATGSSVHLSSTEGVADAINIDATSGGVDVDAAGQVNIASSQNAASALVLTSSAGGIDITATGASAGEDIDIIATGSSINLNSTENAALAIYLHADAGASETVDIHSDQGTGDASINVHSDVGGLTLTSGLATSNAININASDAAGGIDVDCGSTGFIVDAASGPISLDGALASNFTVTGASVDLSLISTAGSLNLNAEEAAADAISVQSAAGGLDVDVALQMSLVSSQVATNAIVIDASDAAGGIDVDCGSGGFIVDVAAGAISLDSVLASNFTVTGSVDLTLSSSAGSVNVTGGEADIAAISVQAASGGVDIDGALQVNIASSQDAATAIVLSASAGGIDIDAVGEAGQDIDILNTGGSLRLRATESAVDAVVIESTAGGIDILASGASATEDIDIIATGSSVKITSTESITDAIVINASGAAGGIDLLAGTSGITLSSGQTVAVTTVATAASPYSLLGGDYLVTTNSTGGVMTITLPAAPATGRSLIVYDGVGQAAGNNVTVDGNGKNIAFAGASAATQVLNTAYESMSLIYNGTLWLARDVV